MTTTEFLTRAAEWSAILIPIMLLTGTILGIYQLRVSAKARRLQALASIYEQLRTRELIEIEQGLLHDPKMIISSEGLTKNDVRKNVENQRIPGASKIGSKGSDHQLPGSTGG